MQIDFGVQIAAFLNFGKKQNNAFSIQKLTKAFNGKSAMAHLTQNLDFISAYLQFDYALNSESFGLHDSMKGQAEIITVVQVSGQDSTKPSKLSGNR